MVVASFPSGIVFISIRANVVAVADSITVLASAGPAQISNATDTTTARIDDMAGNPLAKCNIRLFVGSSQHNLNG
jgi:hypothetical protein